MGSIQTKLARFGFKRMNYFFSFVVHCPNFSTGSMGVDLAAFARTTIYCTVSASVASLESDGRPNYFCDEFRSFSDVVARLQPTVVNR